MRKKYHSDKKGSLELSVNAIIVLVLAIAMLGVGLYFTKTKFDEMQKVINVEPPKNPGNAQDPIGISSSTINVQKFKDLSIPVNFYNPQGRNYWVPHFKCSKMRVQDNDASWTSTASGAAATSYKPVSVMPKLLEGGQNADFQILIPAAHFKTKVTGDTFQGKDVCELQFIPCQNEPTALNQQQETDTSGCQADQAVTKQVVFDVQ